MTKPEEATRPAVGLPALSEGIDAWVPCAERLPPLDTDVLVHIPGQHKSRYEVLHLPSDRPNSWYPGGLGVGWTSHWKHIQPPAGPIRTFVGTASPTGYVDVYPDRLA